MDKQEEEQKRFTELVMKKFEKEPKFICVYLLEQVLDHIQKETGVSEAEAAETISRVISRRIEILKRAKEGGIC